MTNIKSFLILSFTISLLLISCKKTQEQVFFSTEYAHGFSVEKHPDYTVIRLYNPEQTQLIETYILVSKDKALPNDLPEGTLIRTPLENVAVFSSVTSGMLDAIEELDAISGLTEPQYIKNSYLQKRLKEGFIVDLGLSANPTMEKILELEPEAIFYNPIPGQEITSLHKQSAPLIHCLDYKEDSVLGQTEWIRLIGLFFEKEKLADSLFFATRDNYIRLRNLASKVEYKPCVFTEITYQSAWYMPGGASYLAEMFQDAGAEYLWKEDNHQGTISLSFEQVLEEAQNCDIWLMKQFSDLSYEQLAAEQSNYTLFDAYKNHNIFLCNTSKVSYYEDLPLHPDWILEDLIFIFHPELLPDYTLRYYQPMKE